MPYHNKYCRWKREGIIVAALVSFLVISSFNHSTVWLNLTTDADDEAVMSFEQDVASISGQFPFSDIVTTNNTAIVSPKVITNSTIPHVEEKLNTTTNRFPTTSTTTTTTETTTVSRNQTTDLTKTTQVKSSSNASTSQQGQSKWPWDDPTSWKQQFNQEKPWKNPNQWTRVSRKTYQQMVEKAHKSVLSVVEDVNTNCHLLLYPPRDEENDTKNQKWNQPKIKFRCNLESLDDDTLLQDEMCHTANLCLVVLDKNAWKDHLKNIPDVYSNTINNTTSSYGYTTNNTTAVMMLVDGLEYLQKEDNFKAMLNKASYAFVTNRPFFVWMGNLNKDELNRRENQDVYESFGAPCLPEFSWNTMHYYKPISFLTLFRKQTMVPTVNSVIFLDADTAFTEYAFERINNLSPEDYLDLSPQASLMGTQNFNGQIVLNSGIMLVRNTTWSHDLCSLWWFTRCGKKDQRAIWLCLFATFSAWTAPPDSSSSNQTAYSNTTDVKQFAYPGQIFFNYDVTILKALMHFRKFVHEIQNSWEHLSTTDSLFDPKPTNIQEFDGGNIVQRRKATAPLELPHFMMLPLTAYTHRKNDGTSVELPGIKFDIRDKENGKSFVVHSKHNVDACSNGRCWPYIIIEENYRGYGIPIPKS